MKQAPGASVWLFLCAALFLFSLHCPFLLSFFCSSVDSSMGHSLFRELPAPVQILHRPQFIQRCDQLHHGAPCTALVLLFPLFFTCSIALCVFCLFLNMYSAAPQIPLTYFSLGMQWIHSWSGLNRPCLAYGSLWLPPREATPAGPPLAKPCYLYPAQNEKRLTF